jgi:HK97 family phage major capsid protein
MSLRDTDIREQISKIHDGIEAFSTRHTQQLDELKTEHAQTRDRLEMLEARLDPKRPGPVGTPDTKARPAQAWKEYETRNGVVIEVSAECSLAEATGAKPTEVKFSRWLAAALIGDRCEDKTALEYAREMKQMTTTSTGVLIPEQYQAQWIDLIRSQMVLNAAGMTTIPMDAKTLNASAVATDPAASWHTEAGSIDVNNPTFEPRSLTAHTLVVRCQGSVELAADSPNFGEQLAGVMARSMATELDRVGLVGSGVAPEPQGILGTTGIGQVAGVGTITSYAKLLEGIRKLLEANVPLDVATRVAIMSPAAWSAFENLATGIASDKTQLPRPRAIENTAFLVTTNGLDSGSPATTTIFLGDFRDLVLGVRKEASVESLKLTTYASNLLLEFVGYLRADYMLRRPASFCTLEDVAV